MKTRPGATHRAERGMRMVLEEILEGHLDQVGDDVMTETPDRVVRALVEMTDGYRRDPVKILSKRFRVGGHDSMVVQRDIAFTSLCEHHLLPFAGVAHVGYLPQDEVVGLSKLARLVDAFAHRLQLQERLTMQIADAIDHNLAPIGCGAIVVARHGCMGCRGVRKPDAVTVTSRLHGRFRDAAPRAEFLQLAGL